MLKNAALIIPRVPMTLGRPRPARSVPVGVSARTDTSTTTMLATAPSTPTVEASEPASSTASTATAATAAQIMRDRGAGSLSLVARSPGTTGAISTAATATSPTIPRNTQRQPTVSATKAAMAGPNSDGSTQAAAKLAKIDGRSWGGETTPTTTYKLTINAPVPRPCTTRPATKTSMDGASPAVRTPTVNSTNDATREPAGPRRSDHAPAATVPTTPLARGAAKATAYSAKPSRSRLIVGMTVVTAMASKALKEISEKTAMVVVRYAGERIPPRGVTGGAWGLLLTLTRSTVGVQVHSRSRRTRVKRPRHPSRRSTQL